jgi:hypothetical protein
MSHAIRCGGWGETYHSFQFIHIYMDRRETPGGENA